MHNHDLKVNVVYLRNIRLIINLKQYVFIIFSYKFFKDDIITHLKNILYYYNRDLSIIKHSK